LSGADLDSEGAMLDVLRVKSLRNPAEHYSEEMWLVSIWEPSYGMNFFSKFIFSKDL
jgi:hypothetical protein